VLALLDYSVVTESSICSGVDTASFSSGLVETGASPGCIGRSWCIIATYVTQLLWGVC
jgi:hypothetical protein